MVVFSNTVLSSPFQIRNYFVAAGMKTVGISAAGGVGEATAEWIVNKRTKYDMYELEVSRFLGLHNNIKFLRDRMREVPGKYSNQVILIVQNTCVELSPRHHTFTM